MGVGPQNQFNSQPRQQQTVGYQPFGPNPGQSGGDPRGQLQNQIQYQQQRYENQQGPLAQSFAQNFGRSSEADYGNYTDMMNNYRDIWSGGGTSTDAYSGGGGGGGGYNAYTVNPERVSASTAGVERAANARALGPLERVTASNPFNSYKGFENFSNTGGYSGSDIADLRARGVAPIRAAYDNAARNVQQQRTLQGGYSPNAIAAQVKMAREQSQGMADEYQNVNAKIVADRNAGMISGLQGMSGIEGDKLRAQMQGDVFNAEQANLGQQFDISNEMKTSQFNAGQGNEVGMFNAGQMNDVGKYNAGLNFQGQTYNADAQARAEAQNNAAAASAAAARGQAAQASTNDRLRALTGGTNLLGTTPGMSQLFGNQALNAVNSGGNFGLGLINAQTNAMRLPGQYEQTRDRFGNIVDAVTPWLNTDYGSLFGRNQPSNTQQRTQPYPPTNTGANVPPPTDQGLSEEDWYGY